MNPQRWTLIIVSLCCTPVISAAQVEVVQPSTASVVVVPSTAAVIVPQPTTVVTPPPPTVVEVNKEDHHDYGWWELNLSGGKAMFKGSSGDFLDDSPAVDIGAYGPMQRFGQLGLEFGYITGANL